MTLAVLFVATAALALGQASAQLTCAITGKEPAEPKALSFCHKFNEEACCNPAIDLENLEMFETMFDVGLSCRIRGDIRDHPMAKFYCLNCDPKQPAYVRHEPYVPTSAESETPPWTLNDVCPNEECPEDPYPDGSALADEAVPTLPRLSTILVCRDWAMTAFRKDDDIDTSNTDTYGSIETMFSLIDDCGLMKSSPCRDGDNRIIPDRDRYMCGDDMVIPSDNFNSVEQFLNADSMGPPALDEEYGFKLVDNRVCEDAELVDLRDNGPPASNITSDPYNNTLSFTVFNPNCLRTRQQMIDFGFSPFSDATPSTADLPEVEACFNASFIAGPAAIAVLVIAVLAALLS